MTLVDRSLRRRFTTAMAVALALALLVGNSALAVTAQAVQAVAIDDSCNDVPDDGFTDVPETNTFDDEISCLKAYGITEGTGDGSTYEPSGKVRRWAMVTFIYRLAQIADDQLEDFDLPSPSDQGFDDIDNLDQEFQDAINVMAEIGVVNGKSATEFDPFSNVTRDQMASFINRLQGAIQEALGGDADGFTTDEDFFDDVPDSNVHEDNINGLASVGIVQGKADGDYDPNMPVTRGQMSAFIMRHVEVNVDAGVLTSAFPPDDEGMGNQELNVDPDDDVTLELSDTADAGDDDGSDDRQYTATDLSAGMMYRITLVDDENITVGSDGTVSFDDEDENGIADPGDLSSDITVVNGTGTGADQDDDAEDVQTVGGVSPVSGQITFTVDGDDDSESLHPVVYVDGGDSTFLEVDADGEPTEDFGVGGGIRYVPEEADGGAIADTNVDSVDKSSDSFVGCEITTATPEAVGTDCANYEYDANDDFSVDGVPATFEEFESVLSTGDDVSGTYTTSEGASSTFDLVDESPAAPTGVTADAVDDDSVDVDFDDVDGADSFNIFRAADDTTAGDQCAAVDEDDFTQVGSTDDDTSEFTDTGLSPETQYCYRVTTVDDGDESSLSDVAFAETEAAGATAEPESTDARVTSDANGEVSTGDEWLVLFDEAMDDVDATDVIQVTDPDGELVNVTCDGTDATCAFNASPVDVDGTEFEAGRLLTVTVGTAADAGPDNTVTGGDDAIDYPADITSATGFTDADADGTWTPTDDPDNTLEVDDTDGPLGTDASPTADEAPFITAADITTEGTNADVWDETGDVLTVTFSEPVDLTGDTDISEAELEAILGTTVTYAGTSDVTAAGGGTDTLTFTIGTADLTEGIDEGDTVDGTDNGNIEDLAGQDQIENPDADPTVDSD